MDAVRNINELIKGMTPKRNKGQYVFCFLEDEHLVERKDTILEFKEAEGTTAILERKTADTLGLSYEYVAAWITLEIHSSLEAVGFTAMFSTALAQNNISCNVVAGYHHDHIFVALNDADNAINVLTEMTEKYED